MKTQKEVGTLIENALNHIAINDIPADIDLWPQIKNNLYSQKTGNMAIRRKIKPLVILIGVVIIAIVILGSSSFLRSEVALALQEWVEYVEVSLFVKNNRIINFHPQPTFDVRQPSYLPSNFKLVAEEYNSGQNNLPIIRAESVEAEDLSPTTSIPPGSIIVNREETPYVFLRYEDTLNNYIDLIERPTKPDDRLPSGQYIEINNTRGVLIREDKITKIIFILDYVWVELIGSVSENELIKVANGLEISDEPIHFESVIVTEIPPCKTQYITAPLNQPLLGEIAGQNLRWSAWIHFFRRDNHPVTITISGNLHNTEERNAFIQSAEMALNDKNLVLDYLHYPSIGITYTYDSGCWGPPPDLEGYIVIEIWNSSVNVGYGGNGNLFLNEAVSALKVWEQ